MNLRFSATLVCPQCGSDLTCIPYLSLGVDEVVDGVLVCRCGEAFPVHQGVPRLLPTQHLPRGFLDAYRARLSRDAHALTEVETAEAFDDFSFSYEWAGHSYGDLTWELYLPERVNIFCRYSGLSRRQFVDLHMLDAGCGNGTLSTQLAAEGMNVVGMDYSDSVYRAYARQAGGSGLGDAAAQRLNFVQGDVLRPPFRPGQFDIVYADGVLHHTPDARASFMALAQVVKPGGQFITWLYRSDLKPVIQTKMAMVKLVRRATRRLSHRSKMRLCYLGAGAILTGVRVAHLFGFKKRRVIPIHNKAINLFDTISPQYNHEHTPQEVIRWYREAGFSDAKDVSLQEHRLSVGGFAIMGRRSRQAS